jgi:hypothetical protein
MKTGKKIKKDKKLEKILIYKKNIENKHTIVIIKIIIYDLDVCNEIAALCLTSTIFISGRSLFADVTDCYPQPGKHRPMQTYTTST